MGIAFIEVLKKRAGDLFMKQFKTQIKMYAFVTFLMTIVLVGLPVFANLVSAATEPDGYASAKIEFAQLLNDKKRSQYRHNWIKLSDKFLNLYEDNANWSNRPAALFRSALAVEEMARRSYNSKDAQEAASRYEELARNHKTNPLADDALYHAAVIYNELLHESDTARKILSDLTETYPKADFAPNAQAYLSKISGNTVASIAPVKPVISTPTTTVNNITPQLRDGNIVRIVISLDAVPSWRARYQSPETSAFNTHSIFLQLNEMSPASKLGLERSFSKAGILENYVVEYNKNNQQTNITLNFSELYRYNVKTERSPARIIIEATNSSKSLQSGIKIENTTENKKVTATIIPTTAKVTEALEDIAKNTVENKVLSEDIVYEIPKVDMSKDMVSQLGLQVKTIIIDPGHGGRDPGTSHNGIIEKNLILDISKRLARVLEAAGYTVILTRDDNSYIGLNARSQLAMVENGDLFISMHINAHPDKSVSGFETYYLDFAQSDESARTAAMENIATTKGLGDMEKLLADLVLNSRKKESVRLASFVQKRTIAQIGSAGFATKNNGIKGAPFHVLLDSSMPGILVEVGYCSNLNESKNLGSPKYKDAIAEGIANGIHQYAQQYQTATR